MYEIFQAYEKYVKNATFVSGLKLRQNFELRMSTPGGVKHKFIIFCPIIVKLVKSITGNGIMGGSNFFTAGGLPTFRFTRTGFISTTSCFLLFAFEAAIINKNGFILFVKFGHQAIPHER